MIGSRSVVQLCVRVSSTVFGSFPFSAVLLPGRFIIYNNGVNPPPYSRFFFTLSKSFGVLFLRCFAHNARKNQDKPKKNACKLHGLYLSIFVIKNSITVGNRRKPMKPKERKDQILSYLHAMQRECGIDELAEKMHVSPLTIRRDSQRSFGKKIDCQNLRWLHVRRHVGD